MEGMVWLFLTSWELWGAQGWPAKFTLAKTGGKRSLYNSHDEDFLQINMKSNHESWITVDDSQSHSHHLHSNKISSQNPENSLFTPLEGKLLPLSSPLCWRKLAPCSDFSPFLESKKTQKKLPHTFGSQPKKKSCNFPKLQKSPRLPNKTPPNRTRVSLGDSWPYPKKKQKEYLQGKRSAYFLLNMGEMFICSIAFC